MHDGGRILYAVDGGRWVFRFEGEIRFTLGHALDALLDGAFARSTPAGVIADLRTATAIDSTGIGLLVKLARTARRLAAPRPLLFCGSDEVAELLDSVCIDKVFTLIAGAPDLPGLQSLPPTTPTEREVANTIEQAHRLLCELSDDNRERFQGVVDSFARERQ